MDERNSNQSGSLTNLQAADLYRMQVRELRNYAMFMLDPDGIITSWNAGVEQLLGYSEEE
jgi:PAS domain S-box-containing protein